MGRMTSNGAEFWGCLGGQLQHQYNAAGIPLTAAPDLGVAELYRRLADEQNARVREAEAKRERIDRWAAFYARQDEINRALGRTGMLAADLPQHGRKRRVACMTRRDAAGRAVVFATVTEAGLSVRHRADDVCQAIRREGTCGGHQFIYLGAAEPAPQARHDATLYLGPGRQPPAPLAKVRRPVQRRRRAA